MVLHFNTASCRGSRSSAISALKPQVRIDDDQVSLSVCELAPQITDA